MNYKIYYNYDKDTYEYKGEGKAYFIRGQYIYPMFSTEIAPDFSILQENECFVFDVQNNQWKKVPDYRGTKLYHKQTMQEFIIDEINKLPKDYVEYTTKNPNDVYEDLSILYFNEEINDWDFIDSELYMRVRKNINIIREKKITAPYFYNGYDFDGRHVDIMNIEQAIKGLEMINQTTIEWRTHDDQDVILTINDLKNMYAVWLERKQKCYKASFIFKDSLLNMQKNELVNYLDKIQCELKFVEFLNTL
jgi:hypothetical protein